MIKPKAGTFPQPALERTLLALTSPVVHLQPGTLVQVSGDPAVYVVGSGGLLHHIAGPGVAVACNYDMSKIQQITATSRRLP